MEGVNKMAMNIIFPHPEWIEITKDTLYLKNGTEARLAGIKYPDHTVPFVWQWDIKLSQNGHASVYLEEKAKAGAGNYKDMIKVLSLTKDEVQKLIDQNVFENRFEQVNYEGWLARKTDELITDLRNETTILFEQRTKKITGLISGNGINPAYRNYVILIATFKVLSSVYKKVADSYSCFNFHLD